MTINKTKDKKSSLGSSFDSFLREQDLYETTTLEATKRVLAMQIKKEMKQKNISKTDMARRMNTSRSALERLINPNHSNVTLHTLDKAASAIGRQLSVALV